MRNDKSMSKPDVATAAAGRATCTVPRESCPNVIASGTPATATITFSHALRRRLPASPIWGINHQVVSRAPIAAPNVLAPYSVPMTRAAPPASNVSARASSGRAIPIRNVGQSKLRNRIAGIAALFAAR